MLGSYLLFILIRLIVLICSYRCRFRFFFIFILLRERIMCEFFYFGDEEVEVGEVNIKFNLF